MSWTLRLKCSICYIPYAKCMVRRTACIAQQNMALNTLANSTELAHTRPSNIWCSLMHAESADRTHLYTLERLQNCSVWFLEPWKHTHTHHGGYSDLLIVGDLIGLLRTEWCSTPRAKPKVNIASLRSLKQLETCLSMITCVGKCFTSWQCRTTNFCFRSHTIMSVPVKQQGW